MFNLFICLVEIYGEKGSCSLLLVFLEYFGLNKLVDELLHGVESGQKSLRRHDDADVALASGRFSVFFGLERHEIEAYHAAREVNLLDAVGENLFFVRHFVSFLREILLFVFLLLGMSDTDDYE